MKWFNNFKIGTKLLSSFIIIALIAGGIGLIGVVNINKISKLDTKMYEEMTEPLGNLLGTTEAYQRIRSDVREIILINNVNEIQQLEESINEESVIFDKNLDEFSKTLITERGQELVKNLKTSKVKYIETVNQMINLIKSGKQQEAIELLNSQGKSVGAEMDDSIEQLTQAKLTLAKEASDGNSSTAAASTESTIILVIAGMIIAISLGIFISTSISNPVRKLMSFANKIADGDLNVNVNVDSQRADEIGLLANAFRRMVDNTNNVMSSINTASQQVASGAKQLSDSSIELSQGATEQASSVEELTASIEEIAAQTKLNAENANEANKLADIAKGNAVQGNIQMKEMLTAMQEINESSSNISKIIKVIDEIAFQTNILALNAAVEAARAGQHGKGFAVVAEEVRNLAARSANAAKETTDMIEGSIKKVEGGTKIATETAEALSEIVEGVARVAEIVNDISNASNEQATGISQINQGIMQVSSVIQLNSSTSEESAAASEELSSQAEILREQVSKFRLKRGNYSSYNGIDEMNPQVLQMLENMNGKQKKKFKASDNEAYEEVAVTRERPKKIALSDNEFGKY